LEARDAAGGRGYVWREALEREIAAFNPADLDGYRRFHDYAEKVYQEGYLRLAPCRF